MLRQRLENYFTRRWYQGRAKHWLWTPLSRFYERQIRQRQSERHIQGNRDFPPVLVVGNITVGGTGKTPLVIYLVEHLRARGLKVAVISRGYGGKAAHYPLVVNDDTTPAQAGDEPYMIYQRTGVTIVVDPERTRALGWLSQQGHYDLVISDDGLQHYKLPRQYEIVVVDGARGFGNGACLPAGPLREPLDRLQLVNALVINGEPTDQLKQALAVVDKPCYVMNLEPQQFIDLCGDPKPLNGFNNQADVQAIAAIGNPQRFFNTLSELGIQYQSQAYSDHHLYTAADLERYRGHTLLMTEKDAVKVRQVLPPQAYRKAFYLAVTATLDESLINDIMARFKGDQ